MTSRFVCTTCEGQRPAVETCAPCAGRGVPLSLDYCSEPWTEVIPFLWVGGHDYRPPTTEAYKPLGEADTGAIEAAGFQTVVSLYSREGCAAPAGVDEQRLAIPDGVLTEVDVEHVQALAYHVATAVAENRKTLVRCQAGINRSSLVAALAMVHLGWEPQEAIAQIRATRSPDALCNLGFVDLIRALEFRKIA